MQKLVKRKMHYETIMPVEAYHPEDDTWEDEINLALLIGGCGTLVLAPNPWSATLCGAGILNTVAHHEPTMNLVSEMEQANVEHNINVWEAEAEGTEMILEGVGSVVDAFVDALDDHGGGETSPPHPADIPGLTGRVLH